MKHKEIHGSIIVLTRYPQLLLEETNWMSGCPTPHGFSDEERGLFRLVHVKEWSDENLSSHFKDATAVISCLGNRQPTFMNVKPDSWEAFEGNKMVIRAMKEHSVKHVFHGH